jgi:integrase
MIGFVWIYPHKSAVRLALLLKVSPYISVSLQISMDAKSGNNLASKGDTRYWLARVFKPKSVRGSGRVYTAAFYFARFQSGGRRIAISLGTANQREAAARARDRFLYLCANGWRAFQERYQSGPDLPSEPRTNITVGEFIAAASSESHLPRETLYPYIRAFRRIVAETCHIKGTPARFDYRGGGNREWIERIDAVPLAQVTPEKITAWKKEFMAAAGSDVIARRRATTSCNSILRQARALFSRRNVLEKLRSVELPPVLPFDGVQVERRTDTKFYGCGVDPRELLRDAVDELSTDHIEELKVFLLALVLGLRRREVDTLEWQSFDFAAGTLRVMPTKWYALKTTESAAVLVVEPEILALFRGWRAKARSGFVIETAREPKVVNYQWYRCEEVFVYLLGWLRAKGVQGNKPLHALRKLYGSVLAEKHGIHAASSGLRHADIRTTAEFYADRTVKLTAGFGSVLSEPRVLPFASSFEQGKLVQRGRARQRKS